MNRISEVFKSEFFHSNHKKKQSKKGFFSPPSSQKKLSSFKNVKNCTKSPTLRRTTKRMQSILSMALIKGGDENLDEISFDSATSPNKLRRPNIVSLENIEDCCELEEVSVTN